MDPPSQFPPALTRDELRVAAAGGGARVPGTASAAAAPSMLFAVDAESESGLRTARRRNEVRSLSRSDEDTVRAASPRRGGESGQGRGTGWLRGR